MGSTVLPALMICHSPDIFSASSADAVTLVVLPSVVFLDEDDSLAFFDVDVSVCPEVFFMVPHEVEHAAVNITAAAIDDIFLIVLFILFIIVDNTALDLNK